MAAVKSKTAHSSSRKSSSAGKSAPIAQAPSLFRMTIEVLNLRLAKGFYEKLFNVKGRELQGSRVYFDCGATILQIVDVSASGPTQPCAKSIYFSVPNVQAVHARAKKLRCLSLQLVHGKPGGAVVERPWGEKSFYADDPWGNSLCFVEAGTEYKG